MTTPPSAPTTSTLVRGGALDEATSRKVRALSMVGILMVAVGHSPSYRDPTAPNLRSFGYAWGEYLLTDALPRVFVMVFFTVAGFLLLCGHDGTPATWRRKLFARSRSLLVPYLVWSALGLVVYLALQTAPWTASWFANSPRLLTGRSAGELLLVWLVQPIPYQLWFLRDLYLLVLAGPLLGWLLVRFGPLVPLLLVVPYWFDVHVPSPVPGIRLLTSDGYFFYALGGCFAVRGTVPRLTPAVTRLLALATLALAVGRAHALASKSPNELAWWKIVHAVGVPAAWGAYDLWLRWLERPFWIATSSLSFFVFAAHEPLMTMVRKPLIRAFAGSDVGYALQCVLCLLITMLLTFALARQVQRRLPRTFSFLCGGRS